MTADLQPYPVSLKGEITEPLSSWLWLVKWFLLIPHFVVLAFLWLAFIVAWIIVLFAILFTGRYPRSLFNFNVGVLLGHGELDSMVIWPWGLTNTHPSHSKRVIILPIWKWRTRRISLGG